MNFDAECDVTAQSVIISNDGGSPVTWIANAFGSWIAGSSGGPTPVQMTPNTATLSPGANVTVEVSPITPRVSGSFSGGFLLVVDNVTTPPMAMLTVNYRRSGFTVTPPPDSDFGAVPLYAQASRTISASDFGYVPGVVLTVNDQSPAFEFSLPNNVPQPPAMSWTVNFRPVVVGPASATLAIASMTQVVCPPNTFTVTGTGVAP